jgi:magnesium transporter
VIDTVETLRDIVAGMLEVYLSSVSNKLNQVMKVLTVMSSIFIPLTFVAGVYGMNFQHMPELTWHYGYPAVMGGMLVVAVGLLWLFHRKEWL